MKYIFIAISTLFFIGCSPKYKVVNEYVMPQTESGKSCLSECQKQYGSCKEICKANFEICKTKAHIQAQENFERKMHKYSILLESYLDDMEMYQLEVDLMYFDGFYGGYGRYGYSGYYYPRRMFMMHPGSMYRPARPLKPSLTQEIQLAEMQMCQIDCGCTKTYDNCFVGCGGSVKAKQICIENCPSER